MQISEHGYRCEGYWDKNIKPLPYQGIWEEKDIWIRKAYIVNNNVDFHNYRGMSPSRLVDNYFVGSGEYNDKIYGVCWPEGYIEHYIEQNNVLPSKFFYEYINTKYEEIPSNKRYTNPLRK